MYGDASGKPGEGRAGESERARGGVPGEGAAPGGLTPAPGAGLGALTGRPEEAGEAPRGPAVDDAGDA